MPLVLHASSVSPPSRAVMMLIEILGLEVKFKEVSLPNRDHYQPEYTKKNPLHTIPMLEDEDLIIVDSHPIMTYLVSKYGEDTSNLYPKDVKQRCMVDQRLYFDATILFPRLRTVIYSIARGKTSGLTEDQRKDIEEAYDFMETYLQKSTYVAGGEMSVADLSCVATISSLQYIVPVSSKYVKINEWWSKLRRESWYVKKNEPGVSTFGVFMRSLFRR